MVSIGGDSLLRGIDVLLSAEHIMMPGRRPRLDSLGEVLPFSSITLLLFCSCDFSATAD